MWRAIGVLSSDHTNWLDVREDAKAEICPLHEERHVIRRFSLADAIIVVATLAVTFSFGKNMPSAFVRAWEAYDRLRLLTMAKPDRFWGALYDVRAIGFGIGLNLLIIVFIWMFCYVLMRLRRPRPSFCIVALQPGMVAFWAAAALFASRFLLTVSTNVKSNFEIAAVTAAWLIWYLTIRRYCRNLPFREFVFHTLTSVYWAAAAVFTLGLLSRIPIPHFRMEAQFQVLTVVYLWLFAFRAVRRRRPHSSLAAQWGIAAFLAVATVFTARCLLRHDGLYLGNGMTIIEVAALIVPFSWAALKAAGCWRPEASWIDRFGRILGFCWCAVSLLSAAYLTYMSVMWPIPDSPRPPAFR
jgi:hypothetical protein